MDRYCASCGTEVEDSALFCPTCGQPIDDLDREPIPAAPAWPEPAAGEADERPAPAEPDPWQPGSAEVPGVGVSTGPHATERDVTGIDPRPVTAPSSVPTGARRQPNLPITWPVTLSAWLIGVGAVLAALGLVVVLFQGVLNPVDLLLLLALLAIAATVFFAASLPAFAHLRLAVLVIVLIGFGIALDRIGFGAAGVGDLLLFLGTAAAAIGAVMTELGHDQPLGGRRA